MQTRTIVAAIRRPGGSEGRHRTVGSVAEGLRRRDHTRESRAVQQPPQRASGIRVGTGLELPQPLADRIEAPKHSSSWPPRINPPYSTQAAPITPGTQNAPQLAQRLAVARALPAPNGRNTHRTRRPHSRASTRCRCGSPRSRSPAPVHMPSPRRTDTEVDADNFAGDGRESERDRPVPASRVENPRPRLQMRDEEVGVVVCASSSDAANAIGPTYQGSARPPWRASSAPHPGV